MSTRHEIEEARAEVIAAAKAWLWGDDDMDKRCNRLFDAVRILEKAEREDATQEST